MKKLWMVAATFGLLASTAPASLETDFETALGTLGLTTQTARFDPSLLRFFRDAQYTSPLVESAFDNPWRLPSVIGQQRNALSAATAKPSDAVNVGARLLGRGVRRTLLGNPIQAAVTAAAKERSLDAVLKLMRERGVLLGPVTSTDRVPAPVAQAAALVLRTSLDAVAFRRAAVADLGDLAPVFAALANADGDLDSVDGIPGLRHRLNNFDLRAMTAAGHDLTLAVQTAMGQLQQVAGAERYDWQIDTLWGAVRLTGGSDTIHADRPTWLVIDTGGNDVYRAAASNRSPANWVSLNLDTSGSDQYLAPGAPAGTAVADFKGRAAPGGFGPAGARLGVAVLADAQGDDLYRSHRPGLGAGVMGVGVLLDQAGNDLYDAYSFAVGAGFMGIGILEDVAGDDRYRVFTHGQGYGGTLGFGLLADRQGRDTYDANDAVLDFPSPQSPQHNTSLAQGAGYGRRADFSDGFSLAGGVGLLVDDSGDDTYRCGIFGQGVGYWEAFGGLLDGGGKDTYTGQWYVQGASAHFAYGYLQDFSGDDTYNAGLNMALGAGHDFGAGYLLDEGGADKYTAPNLSLGAGNANGLGIFMDASGDDTYSASGITLGKGAEAAKGTMRERGLTLGVFMDLQGQDTYPASCPWARNVERTANWTDRGATPAQSQAGLFWDR